MWAPFQIILCHPANRSATILLVYRCQTRAPNKKLDPVSFVPYVSQAITISKPTYDNIDPLTKFVGWSDPTVDPRHEAETSTSSFMHCQCDPRPPRECLRRPACLLHASLFSHCLCQRSEGSRKLCIERSQQHATHAPVHHRPRRTTTFWCTKRGRRFAWQESV